MDDPQAAPVADVSAPGTDVASPDFNSKIAELCKDIAAHPDMGKGEKKKKLMLAVELLQKAAAEGDDEPVEVQPAPEAEDGMPWEDPEGDDADTNRKEEEEEKKTEETINLLKASTDPKHKQLAESLIARVGELKEKRRNLHLVREAQILRDHMTIARRLCEKSALPKHQATELFLEQMASKRTLKAAKMLLEDRLAQANVKKPTSSTSFVNQDGTRKEVKDVKTFVEAVNG